MQTTIVLSAQALWVSAALAEKNYLPGVADVLSGLKKDQIQEFVQTAQQELILAGCAEMDFDGNVQPDPEWLQRVRSCADCERVMMLSAKKRGQAKQTVTCFAMGGRAACLRMLPDLRYEFSEGTPAEILEKAMESFMWPEKEEPAEPVTLDSDCLQFRSEAEFAKLGCTGPAAEILAAYGSGTGARMTLTWTEKGALKEKQEFCCAPGGLMEMRYSYTETQELVSFTPVTKDRIRDRLRQALETV